MPAYFIDTSGIVKRYVAESGSEWIGTLFLPPPVNPVYISALTSVEVVAAFARRGRQGTMTSTEVAEAVKQFELDAEKDYDIIQINEFVIARAKQLALARALRGFDAIQLAAALEANDARMALGETPLTFVSADVNLNAAAGAEGQVVEDPNDHP